MMEKKQNLKIPSIHSSSPSVPSVNKPSTDHKERKQKFVPENDTPFSCRFLNRNAYKHKSKPLKFNSSNP